jgi:hypothetical protein
VPYLPGAKMPVQATLKSGETRAVTIGVKKAIKVEGSVQEHDTGKPAVRVKVNLIVHKPEFKSEDLVTDEEGQFSLYVLPCTLRVSLIWFQMPDGYFHAPNAHWADCELTAREETRTLAPLEVFASGPTGRHRTMVILFALHIASEDTFATAWPLSGPKSLISA